MGLDNYLQPADEIPTEQCSDCAGGGIYIDAGKRITCGNCDGTGAVEKTICDDCELYDCNCDAAYDAWSGK